MIHGHEQVTQDVPFAFYGSDRRFLQELISDNPELGEKLHPEFDFTKAEVIWAVREEMARTIEDVLARRIRALFLNAYASMEMTETVAKLMAEELDWSAEKIESEMQDFKKLAQRYTLKD
jgi:glycerol-3-phosphate dehydrogenase